MRDRLNLRRLPDRLVRLKPTLRVDQVRRKDGVDERRLSETGLAWHCISGCKGSRSCTKLTNADDIELEPPLDRLLLDLLGDAVETDVALGEDTLCGLSLGLLGSGVGHVGGM